MGVVIPINSIERRPDSQHYRIVGKGVTVGFLSRRADADHPHVRGDNDSLRRQFDEMTFDALWNEGRKMSLEQAVAFASTA